MANVSASVPVLVTGEPPTVNTDGAVSATLLTVPPPVPGGVEQMPSPRRYVELEQTPVQTLIMSDDAAAVVTYVEVEPFNTPLAGWNLV